MRHPLASLLAIGPELATFILTAPLLALTTASAQLTQTAVSSPNLDLEPLGRVAIGGEFDSLSLYAYQGQIENLSSNGSQSLLTRYPNGAFQSIALVDADSSIAAVCSFIGQSGDMQGIIVGGNFTSMGGVEASSIAFWHPQTGSIDPLTGLTGPVRALYCDTDTATVYVGGNFMGGNSTNALAWTAGWVNLPFAGFNGPVNSITKNSAGNIVFAGQFDGLGNATSPSQPDAQVVNLAGGTISASTTAGPAGFADPSSIICATSASSTPWLLPDGIQGWWQGEYGFGFIPTKLRLYNTNQDGRGTKSFHFERLDDGGILNLTYVDPSTGQNRSCIQFCPLPENNGTAQDFHFVNPVGVSGFRIWVNDYYGPGGGLSGIEIFQDDIYSYAVSTFNEPQCDGVSNGSSSTSSPAGTWTQIAKNGLTQSDFLSATLSSSDQVNDNTNVVFQPNLQQSGNYSVTAYTPGCILDNSCGTRGQVNMTVTMSAGGAPLSTTLYQTNNYDKFDQIYYGYIDVNSGSFRPSVTLSPLSGQNVPLTVVASRVRFELISSTGGLNGLFEYNPNKATVDSNFASSTINSAGASLNSQAAFNAIARYENSIYAAGEFSGDGISNIMSITDKPTALPGGGLNGAVSVMQLNGSSLYLGGTFDNTADNSVTGLNNLAVYSISGSSWSPLGAGVNGAVFGVVPITLNITTNDLQDCFAITGNFTSVNAFSSHGAHDTTGFAVWVPTQGMWLHNIANATVALDGKLTAYTTVPGMPNVYGGTITSQGLDFNDAAQLVGSSGDPAIQTLGTNLQESSPMSASSTRKRSLTTQSSGRNYSGVYDGYFYQSNNLNVTILGGSFSATATNGSTIQNLVFINNTETTQTVTGVSGLTSDSIVVAMDTHNTMVFAGGAIQGTVNGNRAAGLVAYDLSANNFANPHPAALGGDNVTVNAVATQPNTDLVFVGGHFEAAGALQCSTLCSYDAKGSQWKAVGFGLSGTIKEMVWASNTQLIIAGNLTVDNSATTMATYDSKNQSFAAFPGASTLPGPILAMSAVNSNYNEFWVTGIATGNNSVYLSRYSNGAWTGVGGIGATTSIRKLQIMPLTSQHDSSTLMATDQSLLLLGNINIPNQGNASAVLFNGTTYQPYILSNMRDGSEGSLSAIFVSNPQYFISSNNHHLALGLVVLIGLAIALGLIALLIAAGLILERRRRRQEGYVPMTIDKSSNLARVPPETLFQNLEGKGSPPKL